MTVSSQTNRAGPYNGNGSTRNFTFNFRILDAGHLKVIRSIAGVETTLTLGTHYTVAGVGNASGTVQMITAPASGTKITILRSVPLTQQIDLENQGAYYAETIEEALDLSVMRDQVFAEELARTVKVPASEDNSGGELAEKLSSGILRLADSADQIDQVAAIRTNVNTVAGVAAHVPTVADVAPSIPTVAGISGNITTVAANNANITEVAAHIGALAEANGSAISIVAASYTATASQKIFTLPAYARSAASVLVFVGGSRQVPTTNYTVSGFTLTLATGAAVGTKVDVLVFAGVAFEEVVAEADRAQAAADIVDFMTAPMAGGTTGMVLRKKSNTDYDYEWSMAAGMGDMLASLYDPNNRVSDAFNPDNHRDGTTWGRITKVARDWVNGVVDRVFISGTNMVIRSPDNTKQLTLNNDGAWGVYDLTAGAPVGLPISRGGHGATTALGGANAMKIPSGAGVQSSTDFTPAERLQARKNILPPDGTADHVLRGDGTIGAAPTPATIGAGDVGSHVLAVILNNALSFNATVAGSVLRPVSAGGTPSAQYLTGTWRCSGVTSASSVVSSGGSTLFVRIA